MTYLKMTQTNSQNFAKYTYNQTPLRGLNQTNTIMLHTKEFYQVMDSFESYAKKNLRAGSMGFFREPKESWVKKVYYSDGEMNKAFTIYLVGYSAGKHYVHTEGFES